MGVYMFFRSAGFLESYFELKDVDATPNRWNLLKAHAPRSSHQSVLLAQ